MSVGIDNYVTFCTPGQGISSSSLQVELKSEYNMKRHSVYHSTLDKTWEEKKKSCPNIYNASKFRLSRVQTNYEGDTLTTVKFFLGETCYKDFIGTHYSNNGNELFNDGIKHFSDSQAYMANPLGVGGLLISLDNYLILMRRSTLCSEKTGMVDFPGGHPEPNEIIGEGETLQSVSEESIKREIFESVLKEIANETNIPLQHLTYPLFLGLNYDCDSWNRPSALFFVKSSLNMEQISILYDEQTHIEKEESTELITIPLSTVLNRNLEHIEHYREMTSSAKSGISMLKIFFSGMNEFCLDFGC